MNRSILLSVAIAATTFGAKPTAVGQEPQVERAAPGYSGANESEGASETDYESRRRQMWDSPEMVEAREWIKEYDRRSVRFRTEDAERYLARLSKLSPEKMRAWLDEFAARRANSVRGAEAEQMARRTAAEHAASMQLLRRQSYDNINEGQSQAALAALDQLQVQRQLADSLTSVRQAIRSERVAQMLRYDYSLLIFPDLYTLQRAAAASLPGNLLPGEPGTPAAAQPSAPAAPAAAVGGTPSSGAAGGASAAAGSGAGP